MKTFIVKFTQDGKNSIISMLVHADNIHQALHHVGDYFPTIDSIRLIKEQKPETENAATGTPEAKEAKK
ncbi:hypothetical protein 2 [Sedum sarmentosum microvirus]|nr:hypothetical protein 2 [Sedum sarmentosum microvirus]